MAAPFTIDDFKALFPELDQVTQPLFDYAYKMAEATMSETWWGQPAYDLAFPWLVAYWVSIRMPVSEGGTGGVALTGQTSKKVDAVSVTYSETMQIDARDNMYLRNFYGQMWWSMRPGDMGAVSV